MSQSLLATVKRGALLVVAGLRCYSRSRSFHLERQESWQVNRHASRPSLTRRAASPTKQLQPWTDWSASTA